MVAAARPMQCEFIDSVYNIDASQWNSLCADNYPFIRHEFFAALEDSGSTIAKTGWQPHHLVIRDPAGTAAGAGIAAVSDIAAIVPLFIKHHSYGEYVFDWAWADAYQRSGQRYYPKLLTAIPFTPSLGPRFLWRNSTDPLLDLIVTAITDEAQRLNASSWHCLFPDSNTSERLAQRGISRRLGCQFHWYNQGFASFDEFLQSLTSRKRKNIRKERYRVIEQGVEIRLKTGRDILAWEWDTFYQLYHLTYFKRSGRQGYLGADFFHRLARTMPEQIVLVIAYVAGDMIAAALNFRDRDTLYGRYWGCRQEFDFLHFEACYYQGIEYAIDQGLSRFDPGAQGEHKIQRGFTPVPTWSNHWIAATDFRHAINDFLLRVTGGVEELSNKPALTCLLSVRRPRPTAPSPSTAGC